MVRVFVDIGSVDVGGELVDLFSGVYGVYEERGYVVVVYGVGAYEEYVARFVSYAGVVGGDGDREVGGVVVIYVVVVLFVGEAGLV